MVSKRSDTVMVILPEFKCAVVARCDIACGMCRGKGDATMNDAQHVI